MAHMACSEFIPLMQTDSVYRYHVAAKGEVKPQVSFVLWLVAFCPTGRVTGAQTDAVMFSLHHY